MNTLESQWEIYRDACYPPKNGKLAPIQEIETRQAFFAGCLVVLKIASESSANLTEEQACKTIVSLINEAEEACLQHIHAMKCRN